MRIANDPGYFHGPGVVVVTQVLGGWGVYRNNQLNWQKSEGTSLPRLQRSANTASELAESEHLAHCIGPAQTSHVSHIFALLLFGYTGDRVTGALSKNRRTA